MTELRDFRFGGDLIPWRVLLDVFPHLYLTHTTGQLLWQAVLIPFGDTVCRRVYTTDTHASLAVLPSEGPSTSPPCPDTVLWYSGRNIELPYDMPYAV